MTTVEQLTAPGALEMEEGYLEYRRACYRAFYLDAGKEGLLDFLAEPRTLDEVMTGWCTGGAVETVRRTIAALVRFGAVTESSSAAAPVFQTDPSFVSAPLEAGLIGRALGVGKTEEMLHANSYGNLVKVAKNGANIVPSEFTAANVPMWDEFMALPFYEFFRSSVNQIVADHATTGPILEAACGLSYGIRDLREVKGFAGQIVGADVSKDFIRASLERTLDLSGLTFMCLDLDRDLHLLAADTFQTVSLTVAWHFLTERQTVVDQVARILAPGGLFVIGYYYTGEDTYDQPLMDLRLSLREPVAMPTPATEMATLAANAGLEFQPGFTIGTFGLATLRKT